MPDFSIERLARKWCRALQGSHSGTEREIPFEDCNTCRVLAAAISEALAAAERIAETHLMQVSNILPAIHAARESGDIADAVLLGGKSIAAAIAALRGA